MDTDVIVDHYNYFTIFKFLEVITWGKLLYWLVMTMKKIC